MLSFLSVCAGVEFQLSNFEIASISSVVFAGQVFGTLFWGPVADRFGRKNTFLGATAVISIFGILSGLSSNFLSLLIFRATVGFGIGSTTLSPDILVEFLPIAARGKYLLSLQYFWTLGSVLLILLAWVLLREGNWRILTIFAAVPMTLAGLVGYFYLRESPRWLVTRGRCAEACDVLRYAASINCVDIGELNFVNSQPEAVVDNGKMFGLYSDLLQGDTRFVTICTALVWVSFGFLYYGIVLFVTRLYKSNSTTDHCSFRFVPMLQNCLAEPVGLTLALFVINTWGRVRLQYIGYTIASICVFFMGIFYENQGLLMFLGFL